MHDSRQDYEVDRDTAEKVLGRNYPWYRPRGNDPGYFAVCSRCDNPVRLIGLYTGGVTPHGRHVGRPKDGFPYFDRISNDFCAYDRPRVINKADRRDISEFGRKIIRIAIEEFDRIIYVLSQTLGFHISTTLAEEMLRDWLAEEGYLYTGAHLRNVPWMIAYFSRRQSLFGRPIWGNDELVAAIQENEPNATFERQALAKGDAFYSVTFEFIGHRTRPLPDAKTEESVTMRVFGTAPWGGEAPLILEQQVVFDDARFAALMNTAPERAQRNDRLLAIAQRVGGHLVGK
ncbi:hypothetical protein LCM4573_16650 [Rhizobium sp. LCM 4573]|nr:hypothetical protein LCM4573_16650 [Rhizobium sp. LCM 4573]